jgi:gliding motility-associated-like protein
MKFKFKIVSFFLFYSTVVFSQLNPFTIQTVVTNEVCQNKGAILTSLQNATTGASTVYKIYKLPNIIIPISGLANATSLTAGDYKVVVTQTLGNNTNSQETTVTILKQIVDLSFSLGANAGSSCNTSGSIIVTVLTGTAVTYNLYQNNQLLATQTTNEFTNLPAGTYKVRVVDNCGNGVPQVYTLILTPSVLSISPSYNPTTTSSCTNITVLNSISPSAGSNLAYPITVVYTIYPPNNAPIIITTQSFQSGLPELLELSKDFPIGNEAYTYDLSVTDNCGQNATSLGNLVDPNPKVVLSDNIAKCGKFLIVSVSNFSPPYTISFLTAPTNFVPTTFNSLHPGPFSNASIAYGDLANQVPFGQYKVQIIDACGRIAISNLLDVIDVPLIPKTSGKNEGCNAQHGTIKISLPENRKIVSAQIIITAPPAFLALHTLPYDLTSFINVNGEIVVTNLPLGLYRIELIDECGILYTVDVLIPPYVNKPFVATTLPNCDSGSGGVKISSGNGAVTSVIITNAPNIFLLQNTIPFTVSTNIASGIFYMNNLPEGDYVFVCKDICGNESNLTAKIEGYNKAQNGVGFTVIRNCGSYDVKVADTSNGIFAQSYWLQRQNPTTLKWQHPKTGVVGDESSIPTIANSIALTNNTTLFNLTQTGIFRVIKVFQTYKDGNLGGGTKDCKETLGEFEFTNGLSIKGAYSLDCPGGAGPSAVVLIAEGVAPFNYSITKKDDLPFAFDNGTNNTFVNLQPGKYDFYVEDFCTAAKTSTYTVGNLPKLAEAFQANPPPICRADDSQAEIFDLTTQNATILGQQDINYYKIAYFLSQNDADNEINPINNAANFLTIQNPQTIFARVNHKIILTCYATSSFKINIGIIPILNPSPPVAICDGVPKKIYADLTNIYDSYEWSTGEKTFGITVYDAGVYTVVAKNNYGNFSCESLPKSITVNKSGKPIFEKFETADWTVDNNSLAVFVSGYGSWLYSLDGINYQTENTFYDLKADLYKVYIKDDNGCGEIDKDVVLLNYAKFFTPNGDGINDKWFVKFSKLEPALTVYIFDRYGKLITGLDANNPGWDGTYNGEPLPSTDYWFVVNRQDGKVFKGHFSMKR